MPWVRIRSRKDPAFWVPLALPLLLGPLLLVAVDAWVGALRELAASNPAAAAAAAARGLRGIGWGLAAILVLVAALLARSSQLGLQQGRIPPSGWWSLGAYQAATGTTAKRIGRGGLVMAALMAVVGVVNAFVFERLVESFLAAHGAG
jgi:hypothetical protein